MEKDLTNLNDDFAYEELSFIGSEENSSIEDEKSNSFGNIPSYIKRLINPGITRFNSNSHFVYDHTEPKNYLKNLANKNSLHLNKEEKIFLQEFIDKIEKGQAEEKGHEFISIKSSLVMEIEQFFKKPELTSEIELFLQKEYLKVENRSNFTCRKLARKYYEETGNYICKTKVNEIIKAKLGLRYRKTVIKTHKINYNVNVLSSLCFIKIITRALRQNFSIIYCDESAIQTKNDNLKLWRKPNEQITEKIPKKERINLILAVNEDGVVYYKLNKENTNQDTFLDFMKELYLAIKEKVKKPYLIALDNLSAHKSRKLFEYYNENKINVIFNSPYLSMFNSVELAFRNMKKELYSTIYNSRESLLNSIVDIIESYKFNKSILYNLKETCKQYMAYSNNHSLMNLNLINV